MTVVKRRRKLAPLGPSAGARAVMGLDQSYSGFGVTVLWRDGHHWSALGKFPADKSKGPDRLIEIQDWLGGIIYNQGAVIEHVCMEGYAPGMKFGREVAGELGAVVKITLRRELRPPVCYPTIVSPDGLKKFTTGAGGRAKSDMKLAVYKKWGVEFDNDREGNLVDSYGLAQIAAALQWPEDTNLLGYQQDVINTLSQHTER